MDLKGRVAFVTGGGSGMGRATARRLKDEGMRVCVVDVNRDTAQAVAEAIEGLAVTADVADFAQVKAAVSKCVERLGGLDLAYLNAGIAGAANLDKFDLGDYRRITGINLDGVVFGAAAALEAMRRRSDGRSGGVIVATSSIAGLQPFPPDPFYTLTKHAVVGFIRAIAPPLAAEGIAAHAICPGLTDTNIVSEATKEKIRAAGLPIIPAEDIAAAVVNAATSPPEASGACWVCQAGRAPYPFAFGAVEGHPSFRPDPSSGRLR